MAVRPPRRRAVALSLAASADCAIASSRYRAQSTTAVSLAAERAPAATYRKARWEAVSVSTIMAPCAPRSSSTVLFFAGKVFAWTERGHSFYFISCHPARVLPLIALENPVHEPHKSSDGAE